MQLIETSKGRGSSRQLLNRRHLLGHPHTRHHSDCWELESGWQSGEGSSRIVLRSVSVPRVVSTAKSRLILAGCAVCCVQSCLRLGYDPLSDGLPSNEVGGSVTGYTQSSTANSGGLAPVAQGGATVLLLTGGSSATSNSDYSGGAGVGASGNFMSILTR